MIIWIGMFIFIVGLKLIMGDLQTEKKKKAYLIVVGFVLFLIFALRGDNYGSVYDLRVYMNFFERTANMDWAMLFENPEFEVGFVALNKLLSYISNDGRTIVVFHAIFCIYAVCRFIYKNTDEVFWAFLFFYSLGNMGFFLTGLRQAIAISVCLFAVEKAKNKKIISFAIICSAAYLIHESALVFAIMYPLMRFDLFKKHKKRIIFPIIFMIIFSSQLIRLGQSLSDEVNAAETAVYSFNGIVPILIYSLTIIGQIVLIKNNETPEEDAVVESKDHYVGFSMTAMGLGLYFLRFYNMALERISFYFIQGAPVALADVVGRFKKEHSGRAVEIIIIILCFVLFLHRLDGASYADYIFFWET